SGRNVRALCLDRRGRQSDLSARLAQRQVVAGPVTLLERLLRRRGARTRSAGAERGRLDLPPARDSGGRQSGVYVPSELAFSQPYSEAVRVESAERSRGRPYSKPL